MSIYIFPTMSSTSLVDYIAEKLYSYSSIMRGDSFQSSSSSFLMSVNNTPQPYDLPKVLSEVKDIFHDEIYQLQYPFMPLIRPLAVLTGSKHINGMDKRGNMSFHCENRQFSPHLFDLVSDSYRYKHGHSESSVIFSSSMLLSPVKESLLGKMSQYPSVDSDKKKTCDSPVFEAKMSVEVNNSPTKKNSESAEEKCNFSSSLKLNLELAHRKTKEMNKRSKKRRRRQKKNNNYLSNNNSASASDDDDGDLQSSVTSNVCLIAESPGFGCTLSMQMSPCKSSFIIPVESDSDDDSEWETFEEVELSNTSTSEVGCSVLSSCDSSPVKFECPQMKCSTPVKIASSVMSFIVPEEDSSDDDSDWDCCEGDAFLENTGFEFTGLFLTNLCAPIASVKDCISTSTPEECEETHRLRTILLEVNKNWNDLAKDSDSKPKSAAKVHFAPDEDLVEVFPVEMCDRKGEWEMYATERLRFKRKINELEKVLSPCLNPEHRSKIFKELIEPEL